MSSRRYRKRIQLYQVTGVADGFGGNETSEQLITETWAYVKSANAFKSGALTDFGITNTQSAIIVEVRKRNDLEYNSINQFIKYQGNDYVINSFPTDLNFNHNKVVFIAVREQVKNVPILQPIGGTGFTYVFDFLLSGKQEDAEKKYNEYKERFSILGGLETSKDCNVQFIKKII